MQSLGGAFTVWTERGMFRIDGSEADALGLEVTTSQEIPTGSPTWLERTLSEELRPAMTLKFQSTSLNLA